MVPPACPKKRESEREKERKGEKGREKGRHSKEEREREVPVLDDMTERFPTATTRGMLCPPTCPPQETRESER